MTDEAALLAAVAAAPDDDTPRLVYADWLDDHGRPERAEFVRVQCRLAAVSPADDDYPDLLDRQDELASWLQTFDPPEVTLWGVFAHLPGYDPPRYREYKRGFRGDVEYANQSLVGEFPRMIEYISDRLPAQDLRISFRDPGEAVRFVRDPVVTGLRSLDLALPLLDHYVYRTLEIRGEGSQRDIRRRDTAAVAEGFAASPHVRHLRRLALEGELVLAEDSAAALARADLSNLSELSVRVSDHSPGAVTVLAQAGWFRNLRSLFVSCGHSPDTRDVILEFLAAVPPMPGLHTLRVGSERVGAAGVRALARSASFPALASLDLCDIPLAGEAAGHLGASALALRELRSYSGDIGDDGLRAVLAGRVLEGVRTLDLGSRVLTSAGVRVLAGSPRVRELRHLRLWCESADADALAALGDSPHLANLTYLHLSLGGRDAAIPPGAVSGFLGAVATPKLRYLNLAGLPVGDDGARVLAARPAFADLRRLGLGRCGVGNAGLAALAASPHLQNLIGLEIYGTDLTHAPALLDPTVLPRLAYFAWRGNPFPEAHARELEARRGVLQDYKDSRRLTFL